MPPDPKYKVIPPARPSSGPPKSTKLSKSKEVPHQHSKIPVAKKQRSTSTSPADQGTSEEVRTVQGAGASLRASILNTTPDLRTAINKIRLEKEEVAEEIPKTIHRKITLIKIRPKKKVSEGSENASSTPKVASKIVQQVPEFKTPLRFKRCNRCRKYGHINKMCPLNPRNLIPPPPPFIDIEME